MKNVYKNLLMAILLSIGTSPFTSCGSTSDATTDEPTTPADTSKVVIQGYVGIRIFPTTTGNELMNNMNYGYPGMGNADKDVKAGSIVAKYTDAIWGYKSTTVLYGYKGNFKTRQTFFEYYLPFGKTQDDTTVEKCALISAIKAREAEGVTVKHIIIAREEELYHPNNAVSVGPFKEDSRILYQYDVDNYRKLFKEAYAKKILKHDNYKLIQLLHSPRFFCENPEAWKIVQSMDGVAFELHQFGSLWPWTNVDVTGMIKGANAVIGAKKDYIYYYGPFVGPGGIQKEHYSPGVERTYLTNSWIAGFPKHSPYLYYYLNAFPYDGGARKLGPETDQYSILGFLEWLIKQVKGDNPRY
jgi:hypothetical protein